MEINTFWVEFLSWDRFHCYSLSHVKATHLVRTSNILHSSLQISVYFFQNSNQGWHLFQRTTGRTSIMGIPVLVKHCLCVETVSRQPWWIVIELIVHWVIWMKSYTSNFQTNFSDWWLGNLLWNCRQLNVLGHYLSQCWPRSMPPYNVTRPQSLCNIKIRTSALPCTEYLIFCMRRLKNIIPKWTIIMVTVFWDTFKFEQF